MKLFSLILLGIIISVISVGNRVGTHGYQVLFTDVLETDGNNEIYAFFSHLGGFEFPHDYQFIYWGKMKVDKPLKFDRKTVFHALSTDSSLDDLMDGVINNFEGSIFFGTFYDGEKLSDNVIFTLEKAYFKNQLIETTKTSALPKYIAVNKVGNVWSLVHYMEGSPNFPHIVKAEFPLDVDLTVGEVLEIQDVKNDAENKIHAGVTYTAFRVSGEAIAFGNVEIYEKPAPKRLNFLQHGCLDE